MYLDMLPVIIASMMIYQSQARRTNCFLESFTGFYTPKSSCTIRELVICRMILWTEWDIGVAYYFELVIRVTADYMQLFFGLKHLQDTIGGLVHKGIVFPKLGQDKIGEDMLKTKPYIHLTLNPQLEQEGFKIICGTIMIFRVLILPRRGVGHRTSVSELLMT
jgi:hypothetical protein